METFGRYQLHEKLGQGGMGVVYRAFDTVLQRVVALKLVLTPDELDPDLRERFFREARAAGHLTHKNIVTIYDLGEHDGRAYIAMEYLDGEDLQRRLARPEKMSLRRKLDLAIEICQGVEYAHSHGVIHRDLKPANIYITESGSAKILDFGLARLMASQLTQSNMLMGTMNYMAPEQVRGERADQRSDIFALGVVLYELLGGRKAFEGDSVASTLYKILQTEPEPLLRIDAGLSPELVAIVDRALAKLRDERYPDMIALRIDLETFRERNKAAGLTTPVPIHASTTPPAQRLPETGATAAPAAVPTPVPVPVPVAQTKRPVPGRTFATAAVVILVAASVGAWILTRDSEPAPATAPAPAVTAAPPVAVDPIPARVAAAQQSLDARQYAAALSGAEAVLLEAPQNAEARRIRAAARTGAVADALQRGTRHLQSGETTAAIDAAVEALALAPENSDARRLLARAGARASSAEVDAAHARVAAAAKTSAAPPPAPAPRPQATPAPQVEQPPPAQVIQTAPPPVAPPPVSTPVTAPPPTPVPAAPPAAAAPAPVPSPSPAPAAETPQPPAAEERISELLGRYKDALEARSFDQVKRLWPSLSGAAENALRQEFQHARRITVGIAEPRISVSNNSGRVTFIRTYSIQTVEGQRYQSSSEAVMDVRRAGNNWVIDAIRFTPR